MIKKLILLSSSLLSLNVLGADRNAQIAVFTEESFAFLSVCTPDMIKKMEIFDNPAVTGFEKDHRLFLRQREALEEVERIWHFASCIRNRELYLVANDRREKLKRAMVEDNSFRQKRRKIEHTENC